jgi:hypothetical protein
MSMRGKQADNARDQNWIDLIAEHGFAINMVIDDDPNEPSGEPPFAYSLGAWESYGVPELVVFGLRRDVGSDMINHVIGLHRGGRRFRTGVPEVGVLRDGIPVYFLEADPAQAKLFAHFADWYYEAEPFPLWQIVWPDRNGAFPWDPAYAGNPGWQPDLSTGGFKGLGGKAA